MSFSLPLHSEQSGSYADLILVVQPWRQQLVGRSEVKVRCAFNVSVDRRIGSIHVDHSKHSYVLNRVANFMHFP